MLFHLNIIKSLYNKVLYNLLTKYGKYLRVMAGKSITPPANPMLSSTQPLSGKGNPQYAVPLIPPITLKSDQYEVSAKMSEYVQQPLVVAKLNQIDENVSQYTGVPYNPEGITIEKLNDLNNLSDIVIQIKDDTEEVD